MLFMPVMLGIGIGAYFGLPAEPPAFLAIFLCATTLILFIAAWPLHSPHHRLFPLWLALFALFLVTLGFGAAKWRAMAVHAPMLSEEIGPLEVQGRIHALELQEGGGVRVTLSDLLLEDIPRGETPHLVRLTLRQGTYEGAAFQVGAHITLLAKLNAPSPPVAPGAFDFQRYSYFKRLGAVGFVYRVMGYDAAPSAKNFTSWLSHIRADLNRQIYTLVDDAQQAGIITALITGIRTGIAEPDAEAMRAAGLAHMLAISGLHVGLVAGAVFFMMRLIMALIPGFALRHPIKKYAAGLAIASALIYMLLAGASVPTQRAMIMTTIFFLAIILDRSPISMRLVAVAAAAILILQPESLISVSFQMSFAAVAALVFAYEHTRDYWRAWARQAGFTRKVALYLMGVLFTTLIAGTATAPFALYHFQQTAVYGNLANLIAVPVLAFWVMPAMVLSLFVFPLGLAELPLWVMGEGTRVILSIAHWTAGIENAVWRVRAWPLVSLILIVAAGIALIVLPRYYKMLGAVFMGASTIFIITQKQPDILVSSYAKLIAFRSDNGDLLVNSRRAERFARENWMRREGREGELPPRWDGAGKESGNGNGNALIHSPVHCDPKGCRVTLKDTHIAFPRKKAALPDDCAWADIVVAQFPVYQSECTAPYIIDYFDTKYRGAHALWLDAGQKIRLRNDLMHRGARPWVVFPPSKY